MEELMMNGLFYEEFENEAIERIKKFSHLSERLGFTPVLGFSGGKDSQVCYDLCKRAKINFKSVFNHTFESNETLKFIREFYPDVEWRREVKQGFFDNVVKNHNCLLPTVDIAYCCADYKHNPKYIDEASIVGVRREESAKRKNRKVLETKNKTFLKKNKSSISDYFSDSCVASGAPSEIQLKPIVDWSADDVWSYIHRHKIPINPEYKSGGKRVGCMICPKANFTCNYKALMDYPKLIDAVIRAREKREDIDWIITSENKDYSDNKLEYVCRWLNHSFMPFTEKQKKLFESVKENYCKNTK